MDNFCWELLEVSLCQADLLKYCVVRKSENLALMEAAGRVWIQTTAPALRTVYGTGTMQGSMRNKLIVLGNSWIGPSLSCMILRWWKCSPWFDFQALFIPLDNQVKDESELRGRHWFLGQPQIWDHVEATDHTWKLTGLNIKACPHAQGM